MKCLMVELDDATATELQRMKKDGRIVTKSDFVRGCIREAYGRFYSKSKNK